MSITKEDLIEENIGPTKIVLNSASQKRCRTMILTMLINQGDIFEIHLFTLRFMTIECITKVRH